MINALKFIISAKPIIKGIRQIFSHGRDLWSGGWCMWRWRWRCISIVHVYNKNPSSNHTCIISLLSVALTISLSSSLPFQISKRTTDGGHQSQSSTRRSNDRHRLMAQKAPSHLHRGHTSSFHPHHSRRHRRSLRLQNLAGKFPEFSNQVSSKTIDFSTKPKSQEQECEFLRSFAAFVGSVLVKAWKESDDRADEEVILGSLAALNDEFAWFKKEALKRDINLSEIVPQKATAGYSRYRSRLSPAESQ